MTQSQEWDRHSILAHMRREKMTLEGIAKRYGLPLSGVKNIWTRPNEKAERAIADFIGVPVETLFRDRYPKTRNRILDPNLVSKKTADKLAIQRKAA
ncbi:helix-turn-helix domain-containing protein [Mesorhizobium sp. 2RAF21]|uniref:helix-turn-helix domain-containing protein n=1 Tax=Mesorhizobium sp. 2RAF21 TaxID=3232995 RepID=UPI003F953902